PSKAEPGVSCLVAKGINHALPALVVIHEDIALLPLNQRQDVELPLHRSVPPVLSASRTQALPPKGYRPVKMGSFPQGKGLMENATKESRYVPFSFFVLPFRFA